MMLLRYISRSPFGMNSSPGHASVSQGRRRYSCVPGAGIVVVVVVSGHGKTGGLQMRANLSTSRRAPGSSGRAETWILHLPVIGGWELKLVGTLITAISPHVGVVPAGDTWRFRTPPQ